MEDRFFINLIITCIYKPGKNCSFSNFYYYDPVNVLSLIQQNNKFFLRIVSKRTAKGLV